MNEEKEGKCEMEVVGALTPAQAVAEFARLVEMNRRILGNMKQEYEGLLRAAKQPDVDLDVDVYYRGTEKAVAEDRAFYEHAYLEVNPPEGFMQVRSNKTRRTLALFSEASIVRVDFTPHEDEKPPVANVKGVPTLP